MLLNFNDEDEDTDEEIEEVVKKKSSYDKPKRQTKSDRSRRGPEQTVQRSDPEDHITRFTGMGNQGEWPMPVWCWMFQQTLDGKARAWFDKLPPVDEMLKKVDDYVRSEEAFRDMELPRGEFQRREGPSQWVQKNDRMQKNSYGSARRKPDHRPSFQPQEHHAPYVAPHRPQQNFPRPREHHKDNRAVLTLDSLVSTPKEILATEHQLHLPQPPPLVGVPSKENLNKYCDYHNEKGHIINDCFNLKRQLEMALESGKLNHLKRKSMMIDEDWMNVPILFPPVCTRDLSKGAIMVDAEIEGYLVRRIHVDVGTSLEIMYEHCFSMLHPAIKLRLIETQTMVSRFLGEQVKPLGKIELDVCFGGDGLRRRAIMKFTVISAPLPYNTILGRPGLKQLRAIPSTIYGMMKFPTPWGVATLVSQTATVFECGRVRKTQTAGPVEEVKP
ncbi:hypothetical protein Tco_0652732 [Tanacetum coccineum]|uniref:Retrotransposon gag domain-containing protein n=1 Tax=Tanacetum coccineum TaxID=301880 RepID=A0ABQ4WYQ2_9ASTR